MASGRTFASLALSTAFVATSVILVDLPRSRAQEPAPDARRQEQPNAQPNAQPGQPAQAGEQPRLIFSRWTKFCLKGQEANARQVCFTGKDGRVESGMLVVAAVLIEPENDPKKVLRVTLPLGVSLQPGDARDCRQRPAHDRPLRDLLQQRLHGRCRRRTGLRRRSEERITADGRVQELVRLGNELPHAAGRFRASL
jgi:invasion protein IalB